MRSRTTDYVPGNLHEKPDVCSPDTRKKNAPERCSPPFLVSQQPANMVHTVIDNKTTDTTVAEDAAAMSKAPVKDANGVAEPAEPINVPGKATDSSDGDTSTTAATDPDAASLTDSAAKPAEAIAEGDVPETPAAASDEPAAAATDDTSAQASVPAAEGDGVVADAKDAVVEAEPTIVTGDAEVATVVEGKVATPAAETSSGGGSKRKASDETAGAAAEEISPEKKAAGENEESGM